MAVEAIRLCRLLLDLLPDSEVTGLLALMLLHESRRGVVVFENGKSIAATRLSRSFSESALRILLLDGTVHTKRRDPSSCWVVHSRRRMHRTAVDALAFSHGQARCFSTRVPSC
ncbi:DUF6596 domain-containing protein [Novipirellula artificiosorum]|uniref:DUF6596 domain-containing protein n=1 Tax=Novipirellula artificiosorum TaxID=2528016 RepID=UPI0036F41BC1